MTWDNWLALGAAAIILIGYIIHVDREEQKRFDEHKEGWEK